MSEINNNMPNMPIQQAQQPQQPMHEVKVVQNSPFEQQPPQMPDGTQALDSAGRAQVNMQPVQTTPADNIDADMNAAMKNPEIVNKSNALFEAALKAGYSYPQAASFATSEVR